MRARAKKSGRPSVGHWKNGETITSAPLYYDGLVVTGISGGEFGVRGRVTAYDAETGKEVWRFYTIPGPGETGHETWPQDNDAWKHGGAPVWQTPAVDPELGLALLLDGQHVARLRRQQPQGRQPVRELDRRARRQDGRVPVALPAGAPRHLGSRLAFPGRALRPEVDGKLRHALAEPSKTGWVYILDRTNGEPLIGIDERGCSAGAASAHLCDAAVSGRRCVYPAVGHGGGSRAADAGSRGRGKGSRRRGQARARPKWDYVNEGRIFTPFWGQTGVISSPSTIGGTNWPPSSYNPETGYLYVCSADAVSIFTSSEVEYDPAKIETGDDFLGSAFNAPDGSVVRGTFTAMDMRTNTIAWQKQWDHSCYSGSVTTAGGLVFVGHNDGRLIAYDARDGEQLWEFQTGAGANATATVFEHDGKQYVMLVAAGQRARRDRPWRQRLAVRPGRRSRRLPQHPDRKEEGRDDRQLKHAAHRCAQLC